MRFARRLAATLPYTETAAKGRYKNFSLRNSVCTLPNSVSKERYPGSQHLTVSR